MNYAKVEHLNDEVMGLRPVYGDIGNYTELLLNSGEVVSDRRVLNSVVKALAGSYAVDLKAQRKLLRDKLDRKGVLPFYMGKGRVFIPLKMRQAITENDAVYGYIDLDYMTDPESGAGKECHVQLSNGLRIKVLSNQSTILGAQYTGSAVLALFQPSRNGDTVEDLVLKAVRAIIDSVTEQVKQLNRIEHKLNDRDKD